MLDMRKIYNFYPIQPQPDPANLPTGGDVYYECAECSAVVNSVPFIKSACTCGNLVGNAGKVIIKDASKVIAVKGKLK
ncbi:MAG: hypothetical protein RIR18_2 [Pseudomonadota bacterium]|jgi:hypothetical protein